MSNISFRFVFFFWCIADETLLLLMEDCISDWHVRECSYIVLLFLCAVGCCFLFLLFVYVVLESLDRTTFSFPFNQRDVSASSQPSGAIEKRHNRQQQQECRCFFFVFQQSNYKERERNVAFHLRI